MTSDVPARAVAIGNPAEVVRAVDPSRDGGVRVRVCDLEEALMTGDVEARGGRSAIEAVARFFREGRGQSHVHGNGHGQPHQAQGHEQGRAQHGSLGAAPVAADAGGGSGSGTGVGE